MIYTIQNAFGEVFGKYPFPIEPSLPAENWADRLEQELGEIVGMNGIKVSPLVLNSRTGETVERVVVDVEGFSGTDHVETVHNAVGFIALTTPPETL